jgi:ubiquinone/menaquinone biosynthesis C-methylase UbiE
MSVDGYSETAGVKREVQERFGKAAANYAVSTVHVGGQDLEAMVSAAALDGGAQTARLLDVGTGAGHTAFAFAPHVATVEALDLTQEMLDEVAKGARERRIDNVHCQLGDAEAMPYPESHFDIVTSRLCAHHFPHPEAFVCEVARVLRPDGLFLLVDSSSPEDAALDTFFNAFELLRDPSHVRNHSCRDWARMLGDAGLSCEALGSWMLRQDFEGWVERIGTPDPEISALRRLMARSPVEAREALVIGSPGPYDFSMPVALLQGS